MQTISFKWVVKGGHIEGISAFMNPYLYLIDRDPKSKWDGWETRKIDYGLRDIYVTIRAKEVDYDKELIRIVPHPWYAYNSVKIEQSNTLAYPPSTGQNEATKRIVPQNQQTRSPQKTKSVTVRAEVFHLINNYDGTHTIKDANRKKSITIDVYDDGNMYLSEGFLSAVRYSNLHGYEYECNMGNDIYAFNYDDLTGN